MIPITLPVSSTTGRDDILYFLIFWAEDSIESSGSAMITSLVIISSNLSYLRATAFDMSHAVTIPISLSYILTTGIWVILSLIMDLAASSMLVFLLILATI